MSATGRRQIWIGVGVLGVLLVVVLAWFALIGPELASATSLDNETSQTQTQNTVLQGKVAKLQADSANMDGLNQQLRDAQAALPPDSGMPDFTRQLGQQAAVAGVVITDITTGAPVAAGSSSTTPVPANGSLPAAGNLFAVPVTVTANGSLSAHRALLAAIEQEGPRRALIGSVTFGSAAATAGSSSVDTATTMTVQLQVFVAPQTPAAQAELLKQLGGSN
jgi:hypothetical protein